MFVKTILFITIVFITWFVIIFCFSPKIGNKKTINISELLNTVENGDLIYFSGNTFPEKAIKIYTGSPYSHVAFIFKDFNKKKNKLVPYIWEADVGGKHRGGPRIMKLKTKLNHPGKSREQIIMVKVLDKKFKPKTQDILSIIPKYVDKKMDDNMTCWLFSNFPNSYLFKLTHDDTKIFCSELVANTLIDLKLIDNNEHPSSFSPKKLTNLNIYKNKEIFVRL